MQTDATLLAKNTQLCWARKRCDLLHGATTMSALGLVAYSLKPVKLLAQQVPTFLLFCDRRSVAQQCCARLHYACMEPQQCLPRENVCARAL